MPVWWHVLTLISSGLWLGSLIFFSFLVAPTVFHSLDLENAAKFMRVMFPRYYVFQVILTMTLTALVAVAAQESPSGATLERIFHLGKYAVIPVVVGFLCAMTGRRVLTPNVNEARDARAAAKPDSPEFAEAQKRFDRWHRISVQVNLAAMLAAISFLVLYSMAASGGRTVPPLIAPAG